MTVLDPPSFPTPTPQKIFNGKSTCMSSPYAFHSSAENRLLYGFVKTLRATTMGREGLTGETALVGKCRRQDRTHLPKQQ